MELTKEHETEKSTGRSKTDCEESKEAICISSLDMEQQDDEVSSAHCTAKQS